MSEGPASKAQFARLAQLSVANRRLSSERMSSPAGPAVPNPADASKVDDSKQASIAPSASKKKKSKSKKKAAAAAVSGDVPLTEEKKTSEAPVDELKLQFEQLALRKLVDGRVQLKYTAKKGRHVVATQNIAKGEVALQGAPYASVVYDSSVETICHRCFGTASVMMVCGGCKFARFCSTSCVNAATPSHSRECTTLAKLPELNMESESAPVRLLIRILYQRHKEIEDKNAEDDDSAAGGNSVKNKLKAKLSALHKSAAAVKSNLDFDDVLALLSHEDQFPASSKLELVLVAVKVQTILKPEVVVTPDIIVGLLLRIQLNAHHITDDNRKRIAVGLYPTVSMINHSCQPNCVYSFGDNGVIFSRAIKDISAGQEITHSYIDLYQVKKLRQEELLARYSITNCDCGRCNAPLVTSADRYIGGFQCSKCNKHALLPLWLLPKNPSSDTVVKCLEAECNAEYKLTELRDAEMQAQLLFQQGLQLCRMDFEGTRRFLETELLNGKPGVLLHPSNSFCFNSYLVLTGICRQLEDTQAEVKYCRKVIESLRQVFVDEHPELAAAYHALGKGLGDLSRSKHLSSSTEATPAPAAPAAAAVVVESKIPAVDRKALHDEAVAATSEALRIRNVCLGKDHSLTKLTARLLHGLTGGSASAISGSAVKPAKLPKGKKK